MKRFRDTQYLVTENGEVYNEITKKFRKPYVGTSGYKQIDLIMNNTRVKLIIHRIVAEVYCLDFDIKLHVNHKDGNKLNNHYSNLEWVTRSKNTQHAYDIGLMKGPIGHTNKVGIKHHGTKLSEDDVREIRRLYSETDITYLKLGIKYGLTAPVILLIVKRINWKHVE